jgi:hypothetical protein
MDYPGDCPPSPEERAASILAANAEWLVRVKQKGHAPGGSYSKYPNFEAIDEETMERDNQRAVAAARNAIEAEPKVHRCYLCGRQDLPRWGRWYGLVAGFSALALYFAPNSTPETIIFGYLGAAALGAAISALMYEGIKPETEELIRGKFDKTQLVQVSGQTGSCATHSEHSILAPS